MGRGLPQEVIGKAKQEVSLDDRFCSIRAFRVRVARGAQAEEIGRQRGKAVDRFHDEGVANQAHLSQVKEGQVGSQQPALAEIQLQDVVEQQLDDAVQDQG